VKGHETPENHPLTILKGLSTVSADSETIEAEFIYPKPGHQENRVKGSKSPSLLLDQ
jgi:hypothetical protein